MGHAGYLILPRTGAHGRFLAVTVRPVLTVGFSHARYPNRTLSIWMGHAAENRSSVISFQLSVTTCGEPLGGLAQTVAF